MHKVFFFDEREHVFQLVVCFAFKYFLRFVQGKGKSRDREQKRIYKKLAEFYYQLFLLTLSGPGGRGREKMSALISTLGELPCYLTLSSQGADSAPLKVFLEYLLNG